MSNAEADKISDRLLDFAARIGKVVDALPDTRLGRHIAGQLVRSATAPMANYEETRAGESRADFVHKLGIALKEFRETRGWLRLIVTSGLITERKMTPLIVECEELTRILAKSIVTARRRIKDN